MARYCRDCGAVVSEGDRFCSECGTKVAATSDAMQAAPQPVAQSVASEEPEPVASGPAHVEEPPSSEALIDYGHEPGRLDVVNMILRQGPAFFVLYLVLAAPTYILPYFGSNSTLVNGISAGSGAGMFPLFYLHLTFLAALVVLAWFRGALIGRSWLIIFPIFALIFDLAPGFNWIFLAPTIFHVLTIALGVSRPPLPRNEIGGHTVRLIVGLGGLIFLAGLTAYHFATYRAATQNALRQLTGNSLPVAPILQSTAEISDAPPESTSATGSNANSLNKADLDGFDFHEAFRTGDGIYFFASKLDETDSAPFVDPGGVVFHRRHIYIIKVRNVAPFSITYNEIGSARFSQVAMREIGNQMLIFFNEKSIDHSYAMDGILLHLDANSLAVQSTSVVFSGRNWGWSPWIDADGRVNHGDSETPGNPYLIGTSPVPGKTWSDLGPIVQNWRQMTSGFPAINVRSQDAGYEAFIRVRSSDL